LLLFVDSAQVAEIRQAWALGVISGVTTNPSLVAQEGRNFEQVLQEIATIVDGPISAEVLSTETDAMLEEARGLATIHPNIVIKVPVNPEGLRAVKQLAAEKIPTNVTLVFSANQALLAARAGATYVSPFVGRLDDVGQDGLYLLREIMEIYQHYQLTTQVIAASIRHPLHVTQAAQAGAHIATIPFKILQQMYQHPLTDKGIERFRQDWQSLCVRQNKITEG